MPFSRPVVRGLAKWNPMAYLKGLKIAFMGCMVNDIGEMGDADFVDVGFAV
jgi:4-hydroxy-3-methylbut-2-en-1-yl diphosphate synthase IspG/GcpE